MNIILDEKEYDGVWEKVHKEFGFCPSRNKGVMPFRFNRSFKVFELLEYWNEEQETIVNEIFKSVGKREVYALDWQHDCFVFNPDENIPPGMEWHDNNRGLQVYFPCYYPDGDYHFFIAEDFSYGLLGHPWRAEVYIFGEALMEKFEENQKVLGLKQIL